MYFQALINLFCKRIRNTYTINLLLHLTIIKDYILYLVSLQSKDLLMTLFYKVKGRSLDSQHRLNKQYLISTRVIVLIKWPRLITFHHLSNILANRMVCTTISCNRCTSKHIPTRLWMDPYKANSTWTTYSLLFAWLSMPMMIQEDSVTRHYW
jgi:hypothetical protein